MKKPLSLKLFSFLVLIFLNYPGQGQEGVSFSEWHQWRGPDHSGSWYNGPSVDSLSSEMVHQLWEVKIGPGYSGPTVSEGHVYVMNYAYGSGKGKSDRSGKNISQSQEWSMLGTSCLCGQSDIC